MSNDTLSDLLGSAASKESFLSAIWEKFPLFIGDPKWPEDLLGVEEIEDLISFRRHGRDVSLAKTVVPAAGGNATFESRTSTNPQAVYEAWYGGSTIIISEVHRRNPQVSLYVQRLSAAFQHEIGANLYFTPAASQGFQKHVDDHDVFVLQIEGKKDWTIFLPESDRLRDPAGNDMTFPHEVQLSEGQALYIPSGYPHHARAHDGASIHLTVGLYPHKLHELISKAVQAFCNDHPQIPRSLMPGDSLDCSWKEHLPQLECVLHEKYLDLAYKELQREFLQRLVHFSPRRLGKGPSDAGLDTSVTSRFPGLTMVESRGQQCTITFPGNFVSGPMLLSEALTFVSRESEWIPRDLPGNLSDNAKLVLTRRLIREGLLAVL